MEYLRFQALTITNDIIFHNHDETQEFQISVTVTQTNILVTMS